MESLPSRSYTDNLILLSWTRDNFGFITYRYTCDAFAALENGHTLRRPNDPQFELCFGGQKQFCKSHYTDLGRCRSFCSMCWSVLKTAIRKKKYKDESVTCVPLMNDFYFKSETPEGTLLLKALAPLFTVLCTYRCHIHAGIHI